MVKRPGRVRRASYALVTVCCIGSSTRAPADTPIYRCVIDGVTTFSDHVCGQNLAPVTLDDSRLSTFTPVPSAPSSSDKPAKRVTRAASESRRTEKKDPCQSVRSGLRKIDEQLRSGYSAKQGVRLDERRRDLKQRARQLKC